MAINQDFRDLFKVFNELGVKYLIVGAYAMIYYTEPRYTKDLDVWVEPSTDNAKRVWQALEKYGAPLVDVSERDFANPEIVYQIGVEPNRIDVMMDISGVEFKQAWESREESAYGDEPIYIIGLNDLIQAKMKAGRLQDKLDLEYLRKLKKEK